MSDNEHFRLKWIDGNREPRNPPNPKYPEGIDLDMSDDEKESCLVDLPYPAKRVGVHEAKCLLCGAVYACTTAGRIDDPRSMRVRCMLNVGTGVRN